MGISHSALSKHQLIQTGDQSASRTHHLLVLYYKKTNIRSPCHLHGAF